MGGWLADCTNSDHDSSSFKLIGGMPTKTLWLGWSEWMKWASWGESSSSSSSSGRVAADAIRWTQSPGRSNYRRVAQIILWQRRGRKFSGRIKLNSNSKPKRQTKMTTTITPVYKLINQAAIVTTRLLFLGLLLVLQILLPLPFYLVTKSTLLFLYVIITNCCHASVHPHLLTHRDHI